MKHRRIVSLLVVALIAVACSSSIEDDPIL